VLALLRAPPTLGQLIELWRYYYFDGDAAQQWWNKPPHPLIEAIPRAYPPERPVVLVRSLRVRLANDASGQVIVEKVYSDGHKTTERHRVDNTDDA
jgi:hypothetical protein